MPDKNDEEKLFAQFATAADPAMSSGRLAPARLRSRIYSALMLHESAQGALRSLPATKAAGRDLCIFEELVRIGPVGDKLKSPNFCRVCHARWLAEMMEHAPIYWTGCPYVNFKKS